VHIGVANSGVSHKTLANLSMMVCGRVGEFRMALEFLKADKGKGLNALCFWLITFEARELRKKPPTFYGSHTYSQNFMQRSFRALKVNKIGIFPTFWIH